MLQRNLVKSKVMTKDGNSDLFKVVVPDEHCVAPVARFLLFSNALSAPIRVENGELETRLLGLHIGEHRRERRRFRGTWSQSCLYRHLGWIQLLQGSDTVRIWNVLDRFYRNVRRACSDKQQNMHVRMKRRKDGQATHHTIVKKPSRTGREAGIDDLGVMSWLQVYTLRLRCYEHVATSGRVVFVIQLRFGEHVAVRSTDLAKRSYSEFRKLWKDLLRATSGNVDDVGAGIDNSRSTRRFSGRESWSSVSKLITGTFGSAGTAGRDTSSSNRSRHCRCTRTSCPFQRLHHLLKDFPFPGKHLLQLKDANALQQRRADLEEFLVQLQRFFCGYPRSFLETAASTQRCQVLHLVSAFTGMDARPASLSVVEDPFSRSYSPGRARFFSYCASPLVSPSPTLLTDSADSTEETLVSEDQSSDNQRDHEEQPVRDNLRASSRLFLSASSSTALPQLHVRTANVETFKASLDDLRANLLDQMGPEVRAAAEKNQLSDEQQWEFALFLAAERGLYADVVTIIRRGTNVNCTIWSDATPLHAASGAGQVHVVQYLLSHGADVDHPGPMGMTPLMYAVNNSQLETTRLLLRAGANVSICNVRDVSPVHLAVVNSSTPILLLLLDHGATVDVPNTINGRTPLHIAAESGDKEICEILLTYGARVSQCSASGRDATQLAGENGHWRVHELCQQYRRHTSSTLLEGTEEYEYEESIARIATDESKSRYCSEIDYIDTENGVAVNSNGGPDDIALVATEGGVYAVL